MPPPRQRLTFPRELLLVEVARRCPACGAPARFGLTKEDALAYHGFECERCGEWSEDELVARDAPEWWDESRAARLAAEGAGGTARGGESS